MPGIGDMHGVRDIKEVQGRSRQTEARELLQKIADQVKPICVVHKWNVALLLEFVPNDPGLLGMNINRGQKICIRLRPPSDPDNFYPFENLLGTMLHELVHNEIGNHSAKFYKMLDKLNDECDQLIREGITGRNMPFAGIGQSLGGGRAPADARAAALKAAERRMRQQGIMSGGGQRLGGLSGSSSSLGSVSAAQRAAAAAQWRHAVSQGCGGKHGFIAGNADIPDDDGWECGLCTLFNAPAVDTCDACGRERSAGTGAPGSSIRGSSIGSGRSSSSSTAASSRAGDESSSSSGTAEGGGLPSESTWTCRRCPFAFPNAAERRTCESCGAARPSADAGGGSKGGGRGGSSTTSGASGTRAMDWRTTGGRGWDAELPPWTCNKCTAINPGMFLGCGVCEAERPLGGREDSTALSSEWSGEAGGGGFPAGGWTTVQSCGAAGCCARGGGGGLGASAEKARREAWVCPTCTLRNVAESSDCAACGIPFAGNEASAVAAAAAALGGGRTVGAVATAGVATTAPTAGDIGVSAMDEVEGACRPGVVNESNEPDYIDLT